MPETAVATPDFPEFRMPDIPAVPVRLAPADDDHTPVWDAVFREHREPLAAAGFVADANPADQPTAEPDPADQDGDDQAAPVDDQPSDKA